MLSASVIVRPTFERYTSPTTKSSKKRPSQPVFSPTCDRVRGSVVRLLADSFAMTLTYLPGIGFREPGLRLARKSSTERDGLTLKVTDLVATASGTDLAYEITDGSEGASCIIPSPGKNPFEAGRVSLASGEDMPLSAMASSARAIAGGIRYTMRAQPIRGTPTLVELRISGGYYGDWSLPLELEAYGADDAMRPVDASAAHEGVTIRVKGVSRTADATALSIGVESDAHTQGIGGMHGMRRGPTALRLRDEHGREYEEVFMEPVGGPPGRDALAVFPALADDAHELTLEVPFVYVVAITDAVDVPLPVTEPVEATLGDHRIRVLATGPAPDSLRRKNFGPALQISLDLGDWQGDRRILFPQRVLVDEKDRGVGYGNGLNATDPAPITALEVRPEPESPKTLRLQHALVQVRGPWTVRFPA